MRRVLAIGHTYTAEVNRQKFHALCDCYEDLDVTVVTPSEWKDYLFTVNAGEAETDRLRFLPVQTYLNGYESLYFYRPGVLERILDRTQPDIIHVEQGANAVSYYQTLRARRRVCPEAKSLFFTWINLPYSQNFLRDRIEAYNLRHSDCAIVGNRDAEAILRDRGFDRPITVCPQIGVDMELYREKVTDASHITPVVGFVGRFVEEKGIGTLLDALDGLKHLRWKFLMVGGGKLRSSIEERARRSGFADRLEIVDAIPHDEVPDQLRRMSVFVLPSETTHFWKEQFGHVLIEAMACGLPVIGSDSGEIPNVIGEAGLVFRERNVEELRMCLERLIEDGDLRRQYGGMGIDHVRTNYTHEAVAQRTYSVYERLLEA